MLIINQQLIDMVTKKANKKVIRRIDPWSMAKMYALGLGLLGFVLGLIIAIFSVALGSMSGMAFFAFGVAAVIVLPILFGIIGLVAGALTAVVYNLIAGHFGGIEIEVDNK